MCVVNWLVSAFELMHDWFFMCVYLLIISKYCFQINMYPERDPLFYVSLAFLDPTAWKIGIYEIFDAFFFVLHDVSYGTFILGCIANFFVDWTFVEFIGPCSLNGQILCLRGFVGNDASVLFLFSTFVTILG